MFLPESLLLEKVQQQLKEDSSELVQNLDQHLKDPNFIFSINHITEKGIKGFTQDYQYRNFQLMTTTCNMVCYMLV